MIEITHIDQIKKVTKGFYFSEEAKRIFKFKCHSKTYPVKAMGGEVTLFVESVKPFEREPRKYFVKGYDQKKDMFYFLLEAASSAIAHSEAKRIAKKDKVWLTHSGHRH